MRFNGTTIPTTRDDTYDTTEVNRDIQTGRAVYADKDKYENDADYKASIDSYVKEGFHLIFGTPDNPSEGGSGGSSLVVTITDNGDDTYSADKTFTEIKTAFQNGETVKCYFEDNTDHFISVYYLSSTTPAVPSQSILEAFHFYDMQRIGFFSIGSDNHVEYTPDD